MIDVNDIDWNEAWKKSATSCDNKPVYSSCSDRWSDPERCRQFSRSVRENNWEGSRARISAMDISPDSRVLDIGAGPGTLAIPLAGMVRHVTAIEPSAAMRDCLNETIRELGIKNISVVPKSWEDIDITTDLNPPYDVVVSSYSLGFPDLREGLQKMHDVSSGYVYIFWFADMISSWQKNYGEIWEKLYEIPFKLAKKPNIIFNLLHQMGIYANVEIIKEDHVQHFACIEEAVQDQGMGLSLQTEKQFAILREYLATKLHQENGAYVLKSPSIRAKIWWKKD